MHAFFLLIKLSPFSRKKVEFLFLNILLLGGKCRPRSPAPMAPKIASVIA